MACGIRDHIANDPVEVSGNQEYCQYCLKDIYGYTEKCQLCEKKSYNHYVTSPMDQKVNHNLECFQNDHLSPIIGYCSHCAHAALCVSCINKHGGHNVEIKPEIPKRPPLKPPSISKTQILEKIDFNYNRLNKSKKNVTEQINLRFNNLGSLIEEKRKSLLEKSNDVHDKLIKKIEQLKKTVGRFEENAKTNLEGKLPEVEDYEKLFPNGSRCLLSLKRTEPDIIPSLEDLEPVEGIYEIIPADESNEPLYEPFDSPQTVTPPLQAPESFDEKVDKNKKKSKTLPMPATQKSIDKMDSFGRRNQAIFSELMNKFKKTQSSVIHSEILDECKVSDTLDPAPKLPERKSKTKTKK